jgi:hypothetical protein
VVRTHIAIVQKSASQHRVFLALTACPMLSFHISRKNKQAPYRLLLNSKGSNEILWHCKHYCGRGLMKHFKSGADLAKEMGISTAELKKTFDTYNEGAKTNKDAFGKKFFHNVRCTRKRHASSVRCCALDGTRFSLALSFASLCSMVVLQMPFSVDDEFHVAIVTPVVHYSMGGVQINPDAEIVRPSKTEGKFGEVVKGLFAAGTVRIVSVVRACSGAWCTVVWPAPPRPSTS